MGAGAVLIHDSQGGGAQGVTLQPPLTLAVDVTRLMGQPCGGPTGHLEGLSCMRHAFGLVPRQWRLVVSPAPGSVAISTGCGPLQVAAACQPYHRVQVCG